jgi:hypothetical protein
MQNFSGLTSVLSSSCLLICLRRWTFQMKAKMRRAKKLRAGRPARRRES